MAIAAEGALDQLKETLREITALNKATSVLGWDQRTYMPPGGAAARAEQTAVLQRLAHARLAAPATADLIERAAQEVAALPAESDDVCLVHVARRDHQRAARIPDQLVEDMARTSALAEAVWQRARRDDDFAAFAPWLRRNIEYDRRLVEALGYKEHPFDALIDQAEPGMTTAMVREIFGSLRPQLVSLVQAIAPQVESVDASVLHRTYDEATQERLGKEVAARFGYDFTRGRLDRTTHPFETAFSRDDVRITTRYSPNFLSMALMGTMHEAGHGMYEQGVAPALDGSLLGHGVSAGMHESQSRLWENYVGRGRPFWQWYYPHLQAAFPGTLDDVEPERFYRAINRVAPSLIRVEADEVTYCLHIMLRFEMEIALLEGTLSVEDAPDAWRASMREYLGIDPDTDREGILQDIHWSGGFGGFQGYALGNVIAAQLWEAIVSAHPDLPQQIAQGEFGTLLGWLNTNIHRFGRKTDPSLLIERATGAPLHAEPYLRYLHRKFGEIYQL